MNGALIHKKIVLGCTNVFYIKLKITALRDTEFGLILKNENFNEMSKEDKSLFNQNIKLKSGEEYAILL